MGCARLMNESFSDLDVISNFSVSSEQSAFPAENMLNKQRRSKVWRSQGYWQIVSGENTIVFQEDGATDLVATIAVANYSTTTSFRAAVKAALEAASVNSVTYTVTQNSNFKFVIASNGNGGATFDIIWSDAQSLDMAAVMGFNTVADDSGALSYIADELKIHTSEWILMDLGISSNPEAFILTGPRNDANKISPSAVIKLQGNETNNFTAPSYEQVITYDEELMSVTSDTGLHTEGLRYWRIEIVDQNPLGYVEIGSIFLGNYLTLDRGAIQFPLKNNQIDRTVTVYSEGGQTFSDILPKTQSFGLEWSALTKGEIESVLDNVWDQFGTGIPFFIMLDPNLAFSTKTSKMIRYVKFKEAPDYSLDRPNFFSLSVKLEEQL